MTPFLKPMNWAVSAMQTTLVFDLDGTLVDTAPDLMAVLNRLLAQEGLAPLPTAAARHLVGAGAKALISRGFAEAGVDLAAARLERLFARFLTDYLDTIAVNSTPYPGVCAALGRLGAAGYRLAICTNKPEQHSEALISALNLRHHFAAIAGRDTFAFSKPDPRHLTETILKAHGDPARALMIGDSETDVATARRAALPVIGVTFGYTAIPMAELQPDRSIDHFDQLDAAIAAIFSGER